VQEWNRGTEVIQRYRGRSRTGLQVYRSSIICIQGYSITTGLQWGLSSTRVKWYSFSTGVKWVPEN